MNEAREIRVLQLDLGEELRGGQRQVLYLARSLACMREQGCAVECVVACPKGSALAEALEAENLPVLALPGRAITNPALLFTLLRAVKKRGFQIVHTHDARAATVGAWLKKVSAGVLLVHARRVSYPMRKGMRGKKYLVADAVVGVSYEIARDLVESGVPAHRVHTIHSGIDPSIYPAKQERGDGRFVFGAVGALSPQKGFEILLQAMSVLSEMDTPKPWEVRIIGGGELFEPLLEKARELNVLDRLALMGKQDSKLFLPQFDALLVPSVDGEGSNAVIKEGWAVGLPVICSSLTANEELVTDKHDGLVVHKGNPLALGTAMVRMMTEPELGNRLVAAGRETLRAFTADRMAELTLSLYQDLTGISLVSAHVPPAASVDQLEKVGEPAADISQRASLDISEDASQQVPSCGTVSESPAAASPVVHEAEVAPAAMPLEQTGQTAPAPPVGSVEQGKSFSSVEPDFAGSPDALSTSAAPETPKAEVNETAEAQTAVEESALPDKPCEEPAPETTMDENPAKTVEQGGATVRVKKTAPATRRKKDSEE